MCDIVLNCPHCHNIILIKQNEINCAIFRHGWYKLNLSQIPPHTHKPECDRLVDNNLIYGCGRPFKIIKVNDKYELVKCGYI